MELETIKIVGVTVIGAAAVLTAAIVIWKKLLYPLAQSIVVAGQALPILTEFTEAFKDNPGVFEVLASISEQFRTDSGSSLKDQVNRLEENGKRAAEAVERAETFAESLKIDREVERRLAEESRKHVEQLGLLVDRVTTIAKAGAATGLRSEEAAKIVASELSAAHTRADSVSGGEAGSAADAAAQSKTLDETED